MRWISALITLAAAVSTSQAAPVPANSQRVDDTIILSGCSVSIDAIIVFDG